jgi:hypothetical protein
VPRAARCAHRDTPWVLHDEAVTGDDVAAQIAAPYYDTAIAGTGDALASLLEMTAVDHLVFGGDFVSAGTKAIDAMLPSIAARTTVEACVFDEPVFVEWDPGIACRVGHWARTRRRFRVAGRCWRRSRRLRRSGNPG